MNYKPLLFKRSFLCIAVQGILIILTIPVKSYAQEISSNLLELNKQLTLLNHSVQSSAAYPWVAPNITGVDGIGFFWMGLGHHDNPTEAKSWTGPKLNTSSAYWIMHIELGGGTKRVLLSYFLSARFPIPLTAVFNGYKHRGGLIEHGPLLRWTVLSMKSKVNFIPIAGYRWLTETARIYDVRGLKPDSLNFKYRDHGPVFGLDFQVTIGKIREISEHRLTLGYLHEKLLNHRDNADKYRIEWRFCDLNWEEGITNKINYNDFYYFSLGLEHVRWPGGRNDWFFIATFGVQGK